MSIRVFMLVLPVLLLAGVPVQAQEDSPASWLSGNVAFLSDYSLRGISQTQDEPALQGGMDLAHPSGLYLGVWGSNVNFGEDIGELGPRAQVELDVYGGFAADLASLATVDLGAFYYAYPGAAGGRNYNFVELALGLSGALGPVGAGISTKYSPDFFAGSGTSLYTAASVELPISLLTLSGTVGRQTIEANDTWGTPDYYDWGIGASAGMYGFTAGFNVVGTNLSEAECFGGTEYCRTRAIVSLARAI